MGSLSPDNPYLGILTGSPASDVFLNTIRLSSPTNEHDERTITSKTTKNANRRSTRSKTIFSLGNPVKPESNDTKGWEAECTSSSSFLLGKSWSISVSGSPSSLFVDQLKLSDSQDKVTGITLCNSETRKSSRRKMYVCSSVSTTESSDIHHRKKGTITNKGGRCARDKKKREKKRTEPQIDTTEVSMNRDEDMDPYLGVMHCSPRYTPARPASAPRPVCPPTDPMFSPYAGVLIYEDADPVATSNNIFAEYVHQFTSLLESRMSSGIDDTKSIVTTATLALALVATEAALEDSFPTDTSEESHIVALKNLLVNIIQAVDTFDQSAETSTVDKGSNRRSVQENSAKTKKQLRFSSFLGDAVPPPDDRFHCSWLPMLHSAQLLYRLIIAIDLLAAFCRSGPAVAMCGDGRSLGERVFLALERLCLPSQSQMWKSQLLSLQKRHSEGNGSLMSEGDQIIARRRERQVQRTLYMLQGELRFSSNSSSASSILAWRSSSSQSTLPAPNTSFSVAVEATQYHGPRNRLTWMLSSVIRAQLRWLCDPPAISSNTPLPLLPLALPLPTTTGAVLLNSHHYSSLNGDDSSHPFMGVRSDLQGVLSLQPVNFTEAVYGVCPALAPAEETKKKGPMQKRRRRVSGLGASTDFEESGLEGYPMDISLSCYITQACRQLLEVVTYQLWEQERSTTRDRKPVNRRHSLSSTDSSCPWGNFVSRAALFFVSPTTVSSRSEDSSGDDSKEEEVERRRVETIRIWADALFSCDKSTAASVSGDDFPAVIQDEEKARAAQILVAGEAARQFLKSFLSLSLMEASVYKQYVVPVSSLSQDHADALRACITASATDSSSGGTSIRSAAISSAKSVSGEAIDDGEGALFFCAWEILQWCASHIAGVGNEDQHLVLLARPLSSLRAMVADPWITKETLRRCCKAMPPLAILADNGFIYNFPYLLESCI